MRARYIEGATGPALGLWWPDPDDPDELVDFSTGWTFSLDMAAEATLGTKVITTKVSGITGAAGSGTGALPADTPNVAIQWASGGEIGDLGPGAYRGALTATNTATGEVRRREFGLDIVDTVGS